MEDKFEPFGVIDNGTTIMALVYQDGVMVFADTRTSSGGVMTVTRGSDKIQNLTTHIIAMRTGRSSVTQNLVRQARYQLQVHTIQLGRPAAFNTATRILSSMCYKNKGEGAFLVAGWDPYNGPQVADISVGGSLIDNRNIVFAGSGSTFLYGYLDSNYKVGMTYEEARAFGVKAIGLAVSRDSASGGNCRLVYINKEGIHRQFIPYSNLPFN